jgi:MFS family permease
MVRFTGPLIGRFGVKPVMVMGLLPFRGALGLLSVAPADGSNLASILPASLIAALGMALAHIPITMTGIGSAVPEDTGLASERINTTYQIRLALGLAAMISVAAAQMSGASHETMNALSGYREAFLGAALVAVLAGLVALLFVRSNAKVADVPVG